MSWSVRPLSEVADFVLGKMLDQAKNRGEPQPYLANVNVRWGEFDLAELREMRFEPHEMERYGLKPGDIVMCEGGEPGRCALWKGQRENMMFQKALHRIRPHECLDSAFLYYTFRNFGAQNGFAPFFTGATIKHLPREQLAKVPVRFPALSEQKAIAAVLSAYDDLIATNQRRIALLEDAARRLYREWFVHLRFPGHESVPVKDGVPEGWAKLPLGDVAEITMGQSPESKYYNTDGDGLPFHQGVSDFGHRFVKHETYTKQATRIAEAGDILCSVRAPVGRLNFTRDKIAIGRGLSAMRSRAGHQSLLFYQLDALFVEEDMIGGGAIFASVGKKELFGQLVLQPSTNIAGTFNRLAADLDTQIENLDSQNQELAKARDLLLPKLMSGQLDVSGIRLPEELSA
jgi:type I restriction enzyme S subunit